MLNQITIKIVTISYSVHFQLDFLAGSYVTYSKKQWLDLSKRQSTCCITLLFSLLPEMALYQLFCLQRTESNGCLPRQPGAGRPHASSCRIRAPRLVTPGFISVTVTWASSNFSHAAFASHHLPHFRACTAYLPPPSHSKTVCWQFAGCPLSPGFLYLLCTAGNSRVVLLKCPHGTAPYHRCHG